MKIHFLLIKSDVWTRTLLSLYSLPLFGLVNLLKECNLSPSSFSEQVTVRFIEPGTYFVDFWQLPPSGFAVCRGPTAPCAALKDERCGTDGGTSEGRRCSLCCSIALRCSAQPLRGSGIVMTRSCVCQGTNDDADVGGLFIGWVLCY